MVSRRWWVVLRCGRMVFWRGRVVFWRGVVLRRRLVLRHGVVLRRWLVLWHGVVLRHGLLVEMVEEVLLDRVAEERRRALRGWVMRLAGDGDEGAAGHRRDLGRLLAGALAALWS